MTILAKDAKRLMVIRARKLWLRVRIAWLDALIWGARNRLRELRAAERVETQDQWRETRRKWIAAGLIKRGG